VSRHIRQESWDKARRLDLMGNDELMSDVARIRRHRGGAAVRTAGSDTR